MLETPKTNPCLDDLLGGLTESVYRHIHSPFPVKSHRPYLILSATSFDNMCEILSTSEAHQGLSVQGFCDRLVTQASSV